MGIPFAEPLERKAATDRSARRRPDDGSNPDGLHRVSPRQAGPARHRRNSPSPRRRPLSCRRRHQHQVRPTGPRCIGFKPDHPIGAGQGVQGAQRTRLPEGPDAMDHIAWTLAREDRARAIKAGGTTIWRQPECAARMKSNASASRPPARAGEAASATADPAAEKIHRYPGVAFDGYRAGLAECFIPSRARVSAVPARCAPLFGSRPGQRIFSVPPYPTVR